ncbi:hypothetical protein KGP25_25580 (plasmid) [Enterobacter sp. JBIWA003]|nr:hypothetical protein KGP25_25580 [Enterobacter sp. JBIWA003]
MATVSVHCPYCHYDEVYRHCLSCCQHQRFRCRPCKCVYR